MSYNLKVIGVHAQAIAANMINLFLAGDEAKEMRCDHLVNRHSLTIQAHAGISTPSPVSAGWTLPNPAPGFRVTLAALQDFGEDSFAAVEVLAHAAPPCADAPLCVLSEVVGDRGKAWLTICLSRMI
jgi:hypothetical protein